MLLVLQVLPGMLTCMFSSFDLIVMRRNKRFFKFASSSEPAMTTCKFRRSALSKFANYNFT